MSELKPCPFCGGEAHTYRNNLWHVGCEHAHNGCVTMSAFVTEAEAVEAWNTRAEIVRCRDCKFYQPKEGVMLSCKFEYHGFTQWKLAEPDGFCAWGENERDVQ